MGAQYFDDMGNPTVMDEGFRNMAELFVNWHLDGTMHPEMWPLSEGYAGANEEFANAELVFYMSGSWQSRAIQRADRRRLRLADGAEPLRSWRLARGMPGGAALVGIGATRASGKEVTRVMEYLASQDVLGEFAARTLFIPAHAGLSASGVDFATDLQLAKDSLGVFVGQVGTLEQTAFDLQAYAYNRNVFNATRDRLTQAMVRRVDAG